MLLLDEPTSALETGASERLLGILRVLRERDVAVVYVSHILEEVMRLCDEVTVLRDGHVVMRGEQLADLGLAAIVAAMLGREETQPREPAAEVAVRAHAAPRTGGRRHLAPQCSCLMASARSPV